MNNPLIVLIALSLPAFANGVERTASVKPNDSAKFELQILRGRVVWLSAALRRRFQIQEVPEAAERLLALEEPNGSLHPLVEDVRGRAFRRDARLRNIEIELLVRKYAGSPLVQIIQVFELQPDGKHELDYWCDICSIAMFELKDCECCQGPIELRRRKVPSREGSDHRKVGLDRNLAH